MNEESEGSVGTFELDGGGLAAGAAGLGAGAGALALPPRIGSSSSSSPNKEAAAAVGLGAGAGALAALTTGFACALNTVGALLPVVAAYVWCWVGGAAIIILPHCL